MRRVLGWTLIGLAMLVSVQHFILHMASVSVISPGWDDLLIGYPMAALLGIAGAALLPRT